MALGYKARRRWALVVLLVGLPAYVVGVITVVGWLNPPDAQVRTGLWLVLEFCTYVALGVAWAIPLRFVFKGVGQPDPDAGPE